MVVHSVLLNEVFCILGGPPVLYDLYAVSNHSGTPLSGHYTAYAKHPYSGEWHCFNDQR